MTPRDRVINIARRGSDGADGIDYVLQIARTTNDRELLAICLDCFIAVLCGSTAPIAFEVAEFLGSMLRDPAYKRIWRRVFLAAIHLDKACGAILPEIVRARHNITSQCLIAPSLMAVIDVAWEALRSADPAMQQNALDAFEALHSKGIYALHRFVEHVPCNMSKRRAIEDRIEKMRKRYPDFDDKEQAARFRQ